MTFQYRCRMARCSCRVTGPLHELPDEGLREIERLRKRIEDRDKRIALLSRLLDEARQDFRRVNRPTVGRVEKIATGNGGK